jgi:hypothetical protein
VFAKPPRVLAVLLFSYTAMGAKIVGLNLPHAASAPSRGTWTDRLKKRPCELVLRIRYRLRCSSAAHHRLAIRDEPVHRRVSHGGDLL